MAFAVDAMVTYAIILTAALPFSPPALTARVDEDAAALSAVTAVKSPKSNAFPNVAIVTY